MGHKSGQTTLRWRVGVRPRTPQLDGHGRDVLADIRQAGFDHVREARSSRVYFLTGSLTESDVRLIAGELLADPVAETWEYQEGFSRRRSAEPAIEIHTLPGVTDPVAMSTLEAVRRLLNARSPERAAVDEVRTARRYEIVGAESDAELERIAAAVLANDCIETWYIDGFGRHDTIPDVFPTPPQRPFELRHIEIRGLSDDELVRLSRQAHLFLSLEEMRAIRDHFIGLGREPTDLELETLAQTWSEHCVHKTLKSEIHYRGDDFGREGVVEVRFGNLLAETIAAATTDLNRNWCLSVFTDNAGVIAFDDEYGLAFKVETHNHPSAIEPYGGAATGVGGCIRDIMGCGLGAKPIASTDVFCLGPPDFDAARLPKDVLHPRRILKGVVRGVRDYGNRMGIPTVNGAIYFDERYLANPLVFCGCVGLIPRNLVQKGARPGDRIVLAGGRTGRDGIHGATFSSAELTDAHAEEFSHAVQIGHAIEEKKLLDALLLARDHSEGCLYSSVTDCGAGGLSSAVGEMGARLGAVVDLEKVPLKYSGLRYDEIWISEAQERMVFAVPPEHLDTLLEVFAGEEVEATIIGTFTDDLVLRVRYEGRNVGELDMAFLHGGMPKRTLTATWSAKRNDRGPIGQSGFVAADEKSSPRQPEPRASARAALHATGYEKASKAHVNNPNDRLLEALSEFNTASKAWVIRQYDHEVQGRSVIKPLVGAGSGPSDAAVLRPLYDGYRGAAIGCGLCPELGEVDPYLMAVAAVDEALRNVVCVGADPHHTAILDNFCWPKVETEESLGALVRTCVGARYTATAYGLPFISGKDSLNNEYLMSPEEAERTGLPERIAIPYTLLISAVGIVDDVRRCVSMDLKEPGNVLVIASAPVIPSTAGTFYPSRDRLPLTAYGGVKGEGAGERQGLSPKGNASPYRPQRSGLPFDKARAVHHRVAELIGRGMVRAAHDVSDGGLAVTIAEMCIASQSGAIVSINREIFGESVFAPLATTYVLEMADKDARAGGLPIIGRVQRDPCLRIECDDGGLIELPVADLAEAWRGPLAGGGGDGRG